MKHLSPRRIFYTFGKKYVIDSLIFIVFFLFFFGPLLNTAMLIFAERYQAPHLLPTRFGLQWWCYILGQPELLQVMLNSLLIALIATSISLVICLPAAYAVARLQFKGKSFFLFSFLLTNAFPKIGLYTAIGILFYRFHLMGTLTGVVIIHVLNMLLFMIWIPSGAFQKIRIQQEEAARDVGAGPLRTFLSITMPIALPGIAVAAMFSFLGSLEEAQGTLLVGFPEVKTMATSMYGMILDYPPMAGAVFSVLLLIPTVIILLVCRKLFGKGILSGGIMM
ncbi:ABC transporter permease [Lapidilactobacillus achengensis]|uniref:ABC transporter permease n=1 Tax=Lapidilactobacillus achengensis TaxID=2486000 RepID=A0ABW1UNX5_9LACO|nr:ABC transporter permease subunit [Lapidilactobacillus achengensis]